MSENTERSATGNTPPAPSSIPASPDTARGSGSDGKPEPRPNGQPPAASNGEPDAPNYPADLLKDIEKTRLTPAQKAEILAELPPPEEMERMYRELQENGGLSFEQLFDPADFEGEPQP
jgi:hypothetical protein